MANELIPATLKGFAVTFREIFKKPITQQYPEVKRPVYPRFRGRHQLHLHASSEAHLLSLQLRQQSQGHQAHR